MNCLHCNKPIEGRRNTKKYCGNTCKQYAYLNRSFSQNNSSVFVPENSAVPTIQKNDTLTLETKTEIINNENLIINTSINPKPINNENIKTQYEEEYQYIESDILNRIQQEYIALNITNSYFTSNGKNGGKINEQNYSAFVYILPRIRSIIENIFQLTYKRKIYFRTVFTICKAIEEMLLSNHINMLPTDFPFYEDLLKLHAQFLALAEYLEADKDGMRFTLDKTATVRYILILSLIRQEAKRQPFSKLFPNLYKTKAHTKPNTVAT
jgi:hypothetical protein